MIKCNSCATKDMNHYANRVDHTTVVSIDQRAIDKDSVQDDLQNVQNHYTLQWTHNHGGYKRLVG